MERRPVKRTEVESQGFLFRMARNQPFSSKKAVSAGDGSSVSPACTRCATRKRRFAATRCSSDCRNESSFNRLARREMERAIHLSGGQKAPMRAREVGVDFGFQPKVSWRDFPGTLPHWVGGVTSHWLVREREESLAHALGCCAARPKCWWRKGLGACSGSRRIPRSRSWILRLQALG